MAKGASAIPVRRDEDESLVLFGDLYKHEKETDMNLLEPMFSVEFEAVQGEGLPFLIIHRLTCSCWYYVTGIFFSLYYHLEVKANQKMFTHDHFIY